MRTGKIYHPEDKHPDEFQHDLNPNAGKGQNHGVAGGGAHAGRRMAAHVKEAHRLLDGFTNDELARIPILDEGARLEQDAKYIDLADPARAEIHARGDMAARSGQMLVPKADVDYPLYNRLRGITDPARSS